MTHAKVNTKKASRRSVRYASLEDAVTDADRLAAADRAGALRASGNWTLGQALGHIAGWSDCHFLGFPDLPPTPFFIRVMMKLSRGYILKKGLPAGITLRGVESGTKFTEQFTVDDGLARFHAAIHRLHHEVPRHPSPGFGHMTRDECRALFLRHAELHLSFFHSSTPTPPGVKGS
jgi:hypothetical protein